MNTKSNIVIACTIIVVSAVSFGAGRLSGKEDVKQGTAVPANTPVMAKESEPIGAPLAGEPQELSASTSSEVSPEVVGNGENLFVASKAGKKYFPIACGSAKTIKKENAIYFKSAAEAEATGRTQSTQCKY